MRKKTIVITGSTASGKSAAAMELARHINGTIINADSLQLYRGLPLLTAIPCPVDMAAVSHKLFAILSPDEEYSVGRWLPAVAAEIHNCDNPIVVGGTALYIKALQEGLSQIPTISPEIRNHVRGFFENHSSQEVHQILAQTDPQAAMKLHYNDSQRISRALEVVTQTGKSIVEWQQQNDTSLVHDLDVEVAILSPDLNVLHANAEKRLRYMFENGVIEEVRSLGGNISPTLSKAIGLREIQSYLRGETTLDQALSLSIIATKQYIKRQRTWFRNQFPQAKVFSSSDELVRYFVGRSVCW